MQTITLDGSAEPSLLQTPRLLSVEKVAEHTDQSETTIRALIRSGRLKTVRIGRRVMVSESQLSDFLASCQGA